MRWLVNLAKSSVGAKVLMALTGALLVAWLFGHMVGNLQVFAGQETLNAYAEFLQSKRGLLWGVRTAMLACLGLHILSSLRLTILNRAARPVGYVQQVPIKSTFASRNMFVTGVMVAAFLAYHLMQFTLKTTNPEFAAWSDPSGRPDVYSMVIASFANPWISATYVAAMVLLGLHLSHAVSSMFQSLGLNTRKIGSLVEWIGPVVATLLVAGNVSMPVAAMVGFLQLPAGVVMP